MADVVRTGLGDLLGLVLPVRCAGCGRWDVPLCPDCRATLGGELRRCEDDVPRLDRVGPSGPLPTLPVWAVADYTGPVRTLVPAWKDQGRADLGPVLAGVLRAAVRPLAPVLADAAGGHPVTVVPVPSSPGARRRRGADLTRLLADAVAAGLVDGGAGAVVGAPLARRRGGRDQVGLGARARRRNASGAWRVRSGIGRGASHLLVDDVVTTGSTLVGCADALAVGGGLVLGAVVVAATPPPTHLSVRLT